MTTPANLLADIPTALSNELIETLLTAKGLRIERIVSCAHISPEGFWYDQDMHEWVFLVQGAARLRFEGQQALVEMISGQYLTIPAHQRHRVEWTDPTQPTIWLAIHYAGPTLPS